ncbi:MAG: TraB/GumN family protein [Micropepsaceae bacterium]
MRLSLLKAVGAVFAIVCAFSGVGGRAVAQPANLAVSEAATPPFWVVERNGKTLYLFGSMHLLPPETQWQRDEITKARAASQIFVFEAPLDQDGRDMTRIVERDGRLKNGQLLRDVAREKLYTELETVAWSVHCSPKMFETFRPWMAGVYLELCSYIKAGFSRYYGVDQVIEQDARARGAALAYFETVEEQLSYFAVLDRKTELAYLRAVVRGVREEPELPEKLLAAWASGKTDVLEQLVDDSFKEVPVLRRRLLVARNKKWVPRIKDMLASDKTHFVTVGVGHLVGRDSVVAMLRAKGFKVTGP